MFGLDASFFLLNSLEQDLVFFLLLVFSHSIIDNGEVGFEGRTKIVEHPNFECVFDRDILVLILALRA